MILPNIVTCELLAEKIKTYFYPDVPWSPKLSCEIGRNISQLKHDLRKFYPTLNDIQFSHTLSHYSFDDLQEALNDRIFKNDEMGKQNA